MNMVEITLVTIMSSAAVASSFAVAENQRTKINAQQEQLKCLQQSFSSLGGQNSVYELARQEASIKNFQEKCKS